MKPNLLLVLAALVSATTSNASPANKPVAGKWFVTQFEMVMGGSGATYRETGYGMGYVFHDDGTYDGCIERGSRWDAEAERTAAPTGDWTCTTDKPGRWSLETGTLTLRVPTLKQPLRYAVSVEGRTMTWTQTQGATKTRFRMERQ